jgi:hypothetical protein
MLPYREPRQSGAGVALACCRAVSFDVRLAIHLSLSEPRIVSADFEGRWRAFDILQTGKGAIRHRDRVRSTADLASFSEQSWADASNGFALGSSVSCALNHLRGSASECKVSIGVQFWL